jgi:DNA-binding MarR family transcriptional regulator
MQNTELRNLLWDMAKTICSEVAGTLEPAARERGLTMIQFRFLCEIHIRQPVTVGMLSHIVGENKGNCSSMCKKLEQAGYLKRSRSQTDERRVELHLTAAGEELLRQIAAGTDERYAKLTGEILPEELEEILDGMKRLIQALRRLPNPSL